ncbi:MAG: DNA polymerase III subunit alpha [Chloroflexi bacterium]|nr:DNA polymerase III subunit alpha [Chloroflexota bacterium]
MDNFSKKIEKVLPAKEVNGSPGRPPDVGETLDPRYETKSRRRQTVSKSRDSGAQTSDNPVHPGWVTGGRGIKEVINEEQLAAFAARSKADGQIDQGTRQNPTGHQNTGRRLKSDDPANPLPAAVKATGGIAAVKPARGAVSTVGRYAELHAHSNYSFQEGASEAWDLLLTAKQLGLYALAITDHDNVSGIMEFAQAAKELDIKPIIGIELTLARGLDEPPDTEHEPADRPHITLLAETAAGYRNISLLTTHAHVDAEERNDPHLDPALLATHAEGIICLSGCRRGEISSLVARGNIDSARHAASRYIEVFGRNNFFLELQQNLVIDDTLRNRGMAELGRDLQVGTVATNNVHYHVRERHRLNDALIAIKYNKSLEATHRERRPNDQFFIKSPEEMSVLFSAHPEAVANTVKIADRCQFDLTSDAIYDFPSYDFLPPGHTESSYLRQICESAAVRRYGSLTPEVVARLDREFALLEKHQLVGFLLQYYDIIRIAREVQEDLGLVEPGLPIEENPPGRGRGSSVALLIGCLTGLSHIDPLKFKLRLDRFLPETDDGEKLAPPDIDLDFPREIRAELILRIHERWGYERAVLTGMISTYRIRGAVRDLGKALGIAEDDLGRLNKRLDGHSSIPALAKEMAELPEFRDRVDAPAWQMLIELAQQLNHFPKYLAQHPGGMILSARPLSETVPLQRSAIDGRYICQWDKNASEDAGFVKIDFLALGALSQLTEALELIRKRTEKRVDVSRIDFEDPAVYTDIHNADTIGVFQIESAAQMQTVTRLRPRNLTEMAWEVGAVRPGVGVNDGVTLLIRRHMGKDPDWKFDHPLEEQALGRTYGVPLYQDQLGELAMYVAGMTAVEGDQMRRAFTRRNTERHVAHWKEKFIAGALANGVPIDAAERIFGKFHGLYQFPEAHAFAFGVTAYQMSWLKHYHPLEFFIGLFNNQPMGFYNLETLKEDAVRHGVKVLGPDVNLSDAKAVIENGALRMGLTHVAKLRDATATPILRARAEVSSQKFTSLADFMTRTGTQQEVLDLLSAAGALDSFDDMARSDSDPPVVADRRHLRWESGLRYRPRGEKRDGSRQLAFEMPVEQDMVALPEESSWDRMIGEYSATGVHPEGHLMMKIRPHLPSNVIRSDEVRNYANGDRISVAGLVIRRQKPNGKTVFITLEDEFGHSPLIVWPAMYQRFKLEIKESLLLAVGTISRREGTMNIVVENITPIPESIPQFHSRDWG